MKSDGWNVTNLEKLGKSSTGRASPSPSPVTPICKETEKARLGNGMTAARVAMTATVLVSPSVKVYEPLSRRTVAAVSTAGIRAVAESGEPST